MTMRGGPRIRKEAPLRMTMRGGASQNDRKETPLRLSFRTPHCHSERSEESKVSL